MGQQSVFDTINTADSLIAFPIGWLKENGADPRRLVENAIEQLRRRGRSLPSERRVQYATTVLLGQFFARWAEKNHGRTMATLCDDKEQLAKEMRPFEFALIAVGEGQAFNRLARHFSRKRMIEDVGLSIGTPDEFTCFVAENTRTLAALFLKNFDSTRPGATRNAVRYLQKTAVSWYLIRRTKPIRTDAPNLQAYLARSKRLDHRTVLAVKLAYLPALLTPEDRQILKDRYGFTSGIGQRLSIQELAVRLRYKNPAALSRKLYRLRGWCRRSAPPPTPATAGEVQS